MVLWNIVDDFDNEEPTSEQGKVAMVRSPSDGRAGGQLDVGGKFVELEICPAFSKGPAAMNANGWKIIIFALTALVVDLAEIATKRGSIVSNREPILRPAIPTPVARVSLKL